ncbi:MAG: tetratricopeptide repeat protein, partial [Sphingomonadaceae bacterium]|nr:tetratricopeptide repeat protein [Sphingomonadaceae bacterium]
MPWPLSSLRLLLLAALAFAAVPAQAQDGSPAEQALGLIEQGQAEEARAVIQAAADKAASTREFEEWFEAGTFYLDLNSVMAGAMLEGQLGPVLTFSDMAFATVADTPLATHPYFIEFSNYRARLCAITGDVDCIMQGSAAAFAQMKGPTGDYEKSPEREATQWRAMAHFLRGEREPGTRLLKVLASAIGKPDPPGLASELEGLANMQQSIAPQIEQAMLREAIAVLEKASGREHRFLENRLHGNLGVSYRNSGMLTEAEASYRAAWRISEREFSRDSVGAISDSDNLARVLAAQGRWDEALPLYRRNWEIADAYRDWSLDLDEEVGGWVYALLNTGQLAEADRVTERVLREVRATSGVDGDDLSQYLNLRGLVLVEQERFAEAEPLLREAVKANSQNDLSGGATLIANLAAVLEAQSRYAEAEDLRRQAYDAARKNVVFSAFGSQRIDAGVALARNLSQQGKDAEAEALFAEMMALARDRADPAGYAVRTVAMAQGRHLLGRDRAGDAVPLAALALQLSAGALDLLGPGTGEAAYLAAARQQREAALLLIEARLAARALDEAALAELFEAGQRAQASSAASAMALNAAQALAGKAGAGEAVAQWQQAQADVAALDRRIAALGGQGAAGDAARRPLLDQRQAAIGQLQEREAALVTRFPRFFDLARPRPATLAETRALLGPEEALVLLVPGSGESFGGMTLALTRDGGAAAPIALAPGKLTKLAGALHAGLAAPESGFTDAEEYDPPRVFYDRAAALELYRALFGARQVAALLADRTRWTLAPQQGLMGIAFDALVTAPPPGGSAGDTDPASLRTTAWLGIERGKIEL